MVRTSRGRIRRRRLKTTTYPTTSACCASRDIVLQMSLGLDVFAAICSHNYCMVAPPDPVHVLWNLIVRIECVLCLAVTYGVHTFDRYKCESDIVGFCFLKLLCVKIRRHWHVVLWDLRCCSKYQSCNAHALLVYFIVIIFSNVPFILSQRILPDCGTHVFVSYWSIGG